MKSKFNENYTWNYLQSPAADPMFKSIIDNIIKYDCKKVLDLACGYSRINEFLGDYKCLIDGIDTNSECIEYCQKTFNGTYIEGDVLEFEKSSMQGPYDCIVVSGFFYYLGQNILHFFEKLVDFYKPKIIIITDPMPRKDYKSPDYSDLLINYAYTVEPLYLDIRMGARNVYTFFVDYKRPEFKIKADFKKDSIHDHWLADDYDRNTLKHCVYLTNTEHLNSERDGLLYPADTSCTRYISVSAGFKSIYKSAIDWYPGKKFEFIYVDIVPTALDYRIHMDRHIGQWSLNTILDNYIETVNDNIITKSGDKNEDISAVVQNQVQELGLEEYWDDFLIEYSLAPKRYIRLDLLNNVKLFNSLIQSDENTWLWYSNAPDWHQFRFNETTFQNWKQYLNERNKNITFAGKTPPFTSS